MDQIVNRKNQIRARLMETNGWTLADWARKNDFKPIDVRQTVNRYLDPVAPPPKLSGIQVQKILRSLQEETGVTCLPPAAGDGIEGAQQ